MAELSNNEIKRIRSLSQKKFRDSLGLFVVEGEKMVAEAEGSDFIVEAVYRKEEIGEELMSRISALDSPSPVLAVVRKSGPTWLRKGAEGDIDINEGLFLALDSIRDPGNLGTILRIADWFGVKAVFASPDTVDSFNPKVVQATMGAIFRVPLIVCDIRTVCTRFQACGKPVYGTLLDGKDIYSAPLAADGLIVMGNESNGISPEVRTMLTSRLLIPSYAEGASHAESLNVAIATAVTVAEFKRRATH